LAGGNYKIKDSGHRRVHDTGAQRDRSAGKGRNDLRSPFVDEACSIHFEFGGDKYGERNWEKGQPLSWYIDSQIRHMNKFRMGLWDENHLIAQYWNSHCLVDTWIKIERGILPAKLNDMPVYKKIFPEVKIKRF